MQAWMLIGLLVSLSPDSLLDALGQKLQSIQDYTCVLESYERLGKKEIQRTYAYQYMRPGWVKMVITAGDSKGARLSYNPDLGKVRAAKGGILGAIKISVSPENRRVRSLRGGRVDRSGWPEVLRELRHLLSTADTAWVKDSAGFWILEMQGVEGELPDVDRVRVWVSQADSLLVGYDEYDDQHALVHRVRYREVRTNVGLQQEDFNL